MKISITIVFLVLLTTMNVNAQNAGEVNYRFRAGGNLSTITGIDDAKHLKTM